MYEKLPIMLVSSHVTQNYISRLLTGQSPVKCPYAKENGKNLVVRRILMSEVNFCETKHKAEKAGLAKNTLPA